MEYINILTPAGTVYHMPNSFSMDRNEPIAYGIASWWTYHDEIKDINWVYEKGFVLPNWNEG